MEILNSVISRIIDHTIIPVARQVGYFIFYKSNLEDLKSKLENFDFVKLRMMHEVDEVGRDVNQKVEADVQKWLADAEKTTIEAEAFLRDEGRARTKCLIICPNLKYYHWRSRKSTKLMGKIEAHENRKREFHSISYNASVKEISAIASNEYMAFESRTSMVKDIITELKKPDINKIGVYGLGGIGKTVLAKEVHRRAVEEMLFDDVVIILNVKEKKDNETIQKAIIKKLRMDVDESVDMGTRANLLQARIKGGKTLVILDDVLERIDFEDVGLGVPNCKLLLTSRERNDLFYGMHTQKDFQLGPLTENESWSLFEKMAGNVVKDNRILKEATQLAKKCGGLPVLVVTVASALRESSLEEWKDALIRFKRFDKEKNEKAFLTLQWSYEQLEDQEHKQLFLLCGVMAGESCEIYLSDLFKCSMGLGLIKNVETVEEARVSLNLMVKKLKNSCLLLDGYVDTTVRMRELVRKVAIRIAFGDEVKEVPRERPEVKLLILSDNCKGDSQEISKFISFFSKSKQLTNDTNANEIVLEDEAGGPPRLFSNGEVLMPNLTTLIVHQCDSIRFLFSNSMAKCLGQLKHLKISKCQALQVVYDTSSTTQLNGLKCPNLNSVEIDSCDSLKNVFPASVAKDLKQLSKLKVENCGLMEEIVAKEEGPQTTYEEFEFPEVTFMEFHNLPQLGSFYPRLHVSNWPSLNFLKVTKCGGVKILHAELSKYQDKLDLGHPTPMKQPFFFIEKGKSFLNLEYLTLDENMEIWYEPYGPLPAELLSKVKSIYFATSHPKSDVFFENLHNIEKLCVLSAPWKELHKVETFPRVKVLWLINMSELIRLEMENSQLGRPVFPNLEVLCVHKCGRLENLASSLISFRNLTTFTIGYCHGLQYLLPHSVAKNLQQLKELDVKFCERMVEIVASNIDDPKNEITLSCLQRLNLSGLPRLQGFCTGNCIFKVPSLLPKDLFVKKCQLIKLKISPDGLLLSDPRPERLEIAEETDDVLIQRRMTVIKPSS